jgi:hypothetical protein
MIFVIVPLGKEAKDVLGWVVRVIMYTAGSMVGAATLALGLGLVGAGIYAIAPGLAGGWVTVALGLFALVYALHEMNILHLPNPQLKWLVPKVWMKSSRLFGNTAYGIALGAGIFTFIPFTSFYVLLAWEIAAGMMSLQAAVTLGMLYGLARGIPAVLGGISMLKGVYPIPLNNWLIAHLGWWHALNALALLLVGTFLLSSYIV